MSMHTRNKISFGTVLIIVQIIIIVMYGVFLRPLLHNNESQNTNYYPMYQDVNVMMLVGFGFLMTFAKHNAYSATAYTFFINAIVVQLYLLLAPFWHKIFEGNWSEKIQIAQKSFTSASYSVAAVLISFGAVLGRVGPLQLLIMALIQIVGYTLNQQIVYERIHAYDVGGSTAIHTFGAYFGLTVSWILSRKVKPTNKPQTTYFSNVFAFIGTMFLWMYWPSFNAGFFPQFPYQRSLIIINTILSLTGSCLGTFITMSYFRKFFVIEDILNATLAGGVIIGAGAGLYTNLAAALSIGLFGGIISSLGYIYLQQKLETKLNLFDTCGVHNLHAIPGVLGGIFGAIAIAAYSSAPLNNPLQQSYLPFYSKSPTGLNAQGRTFYEQGGIQLASIFISMGVAIGFGIIAGFCINCVYEHKPNEFFTDNIYFENVPLLEQTNSSKNETGKKVVDTNDKSNHPSSRQFLDRKICL